MSVRRRRSLRNTLTDEDERQGALNARRSFQATVQRLLAVRWFTTTPGVKISHLSRRGCCPTSEPCQEEEVVLAGVLTSPFLMHQATELLQHFQHELSGIHGFFDELGVLPQKVTESRLGGEVMPMAAGHKKEILMRLAVKAVHQTKWTTVRLCWQLFMQKQDQELKRLRQHYDELQQQFLTVRQEYLQEVALLRDQTRVRGDVDSSDWQIQGVSSDVVYFFDPTKALTPKETEFVLRAVKEKLLMILETNPRIAGGVDLGQLEKLRELQEGQEVQEIKRALARRSHEVAELQQTVAQLQEELVTPKGLEPKLHSKIIADLEEKVADLRSSAVQLKQDLKAEVKERRTAENSLETARLERSELQSCLRQYEEEQVSLQSMIRTARKELEECQENVQDLRAKERDLEAKAATLSETCFGLKKALRRAKLAATLRTPASPASPASPSTPASPLRVKDAVFLEERLMPELVPEAREDGEVLATEAVLPKEEGLSVDLSLLHEAHEQLLEAWAKRDAEMAKVEELTHQNAQLRRQLAKQSQGLILMEADDSAGTAQHLSSFVKTMRDQLSRVRSSDALDCEEDGGLQLAFPELEAELASVSANAAETLSAVRTSLGQVVSSPADLDQVQRLQEKALSLQGRKRALEKQLLQSSTERLSSELDTLGQIASGTRDGSTDPDLVGDTTAIVRKIRGLAMATIQLLVEVGQKMHHLAVENTELREALLSLSSRLTQATSLMETLPELPGDGALQKCLSTINTINQDHVPAVFNRLFNDSRRPSHRLKRQAQERKADLMKSSCIHLAEALPNRPSSGERGLAPVHLDSYVAEERGSATRAGLQVAHVRSADAKELRVPTSSPGRRPPGFSRQVTPDDVALENVQDKKVLPKPKQRRESLRMSSFELKPDMNQAVDNFFEQARHAEDALFPASPNTRVLSAAGPSRADSAEVGLNDLASSGRSRKLFKQKSFPDAEVIDSGISGFGGFGGLERPRVSRQRSGREPRLHSTEIRAELNKAFDKAMGKASPRQPQAKPPTHKEEGFVLPLMTQAACHASPRTPISPSSGEDVLSNPTGARAPSVFSESSDESGESVIHAATCPSGEEQNLKWQSLPVVPIVSIQHLELGQDSRASKSSIESPAFSARRPTVKTDASSSPHPRSPKEFWRSSMTQTARRRLDATSMVHRPDPPQTRRGSLM